MFYNNSKDLYIKCSKINIGLSNYIPLNPFKYVGVYPIWIRDNKELIVFRWLDLNPNILQWSSESILIKYWNFDQQKLSDYFPDLWCHDAWGRSFLIEVKAKSQLNIINNQNKHIAAHEWCVSNNTIWNIITEDYMHLYHNPVHIINTKKEELYD